MSERPPKLSSRQTAQQLRRLKEAQARERYEPPAPGANYGRNVLAADDERVSRILKAMGFPAWLSPADAAALNGIPEEVFEKWMSSGLSDALDERDTLNARFARVVRAQVSAMEGDLRGRIRQSKTAFEAANLTKILERTRPLVAPKASKEGNAHDAIADALEGAEVTAPPLLPNAVPSDGAATCVDEEDCCGCYGGCSCDRCAPTARNAVAVEVA